MSLYKRPDSRIWWAAISLPDGGRVCRSSGTANRQGAQEWLDHVRADLWRIHRLGERPTYTWQDAVVRWCAEKTHKATAHEDRAKFQWLDGYLRGRLLHTITRDEIQAIGEAKARESSRATANRYLGLLRSVLKRAAGPWEWIERAPYVTLSGGCVGSPKRRSHGSCMRCHRTNDNSHASPSQQDCAKPMCLVCDGPMSIWNAAPLGSTPMKPKAAPRSVFR